MDERENHLILLIKALRLYIHMTMCFAALHVYLFEYERMRFERRNLGQMTFCRLQIRSTEIQRITRVSDTNCIWELRMDRNAFVMLCALLKTLGGLLDDGNVTIEEQVATFVNILAHHTKNRSVQVRFYRSDETISWYVHRVLRALLHLENVLFVKPTPVPDDCTDSRWRWFKFVYVLSGWERSATDSRVLRDAITRHNGLKIPFVIISNYYLADAWYTNGQGFVAPYRGTRYHLQEWEDFDRAPRNHEKYFNMKHSKAGNIIERCFGKFDMSDRRNWTPEEEDVMITILEGIVVDGGRCDTGSFRPGTYKFVVSKMREKFEKITITRKHVQKKMKRLKDKYSVAYDMLNTSGFGWNDTHKCVTVSPEILEEYLKKHPNKNYTANRPFPHYERLVTMFGKDRATGNMSESAADALDNMGLETEESDTAGFTQPSTTPSNVAYASPDPNTRETSKRKRKRNVSSTTEEITKVFEKSMERASVDIAKLTEAITGGDAMTRLGVELEDCTCACQASGQVIFEL
ncbi:hypothetical protein Ddye_006139 [Dipteronia dyeriana]|uniref:Myb/SANT-like domain-containing protein n=1 Tax=Dipteronia dyeriana TaxID=168575 RepID=A0AAE0CQG2_9ROSI|nr:hypothetical protein Ddye_006139 [Dipteronia dyeriana]